MTDHLKNWALWTAVGIAMLFLNAVLERSDTDELTAQVVNDNAAEWVAINNPKE